MTDVPLIGQLRLSLKMEDLLKRAFEQIAKEIMLNPFGPILYDAYNRQVWARKTIDGGGEIRCPVNV